MNNRTDILMTALMAMAMGGSGYNSTPSCFQVDTGDIRIHKHGEPFTNDPVLRKKKKDHRRKKRVRKNKRGY